MNELRLILRAVGSLWFAAVLLLLLLVAMACATVFEAAHGTESALETFYRSWWFEAVLWLLAININAAIFARYPFSRKHIGFVLAHAAIDLVLVGALVTRHFGVDGQLGFAEGESVSHFTDRYANELVIAERDGAGNFTFDLGSDIGNARRAIYQPNVPELRFGEATASVERYLPDSEWSQSVTEAVDARLPAAVELSLSPTGTASPTWVMAGRPQRLGPLTVAFRSVPDRAELDRLLNETPANESASIGTVRVVYDAETIEIPVEECTAQAQRLGETGYTVRVLRYLPHAIVGEDRKLKNMSNQPVNPAIEVEFVGPESRETRIAFAKFPGFTHGTEADTQLKLTFVAGAHPTPDTPIEVLSGPDNELYVRFSGQAMPTTSQAVEIGAPVETPWAGQKFAVLRHFLHADEEWTLNAVEPIRQNRMAAILLELNSGGEQRRVELQKYQPISIRIGGKLYELAFRNKQIPLGFTVTLNRFHLGTYPGSNQPRSFESHVTIVDPVTGREQNRIVSMNRPLKHGGYSLCQSDYDMNRLQTASYLSVSRDPGRPIVFAGYTIIMIGMIVLMVTRATEKRRSGELATGVQLTPTGAQQVRQSCPT